MHIRQGHLTFNVRNNLDVDNLEAILIELFLKKTKPIVVGCVYTPPTKLDFLEEFEERADYINCFVERYMPVRALRSSCNGILLYLK